MQRIQNKIAFFLPSLAGGGAEKIALNLARSLSERGFDIDIVLGDASGEYLQHVPASIRVVGLGKSRPFLAIPALIKYLRAEQPAVLFSTIINANIAALLAQLLSGITIRCVIREASTLSVDLDHSSVFNRFLIPRLVFWIYPRAHAIIVPSHGVADDFAKVTGLPRESIQVIYNPVVTKTLLDQAQQPIDHPWLQTAETPVIIGMGRLTRQKDFETLIRAFARVKRELPARLILLGEGEDREELEDLCQNLGIENDVDFRGFASNPYAFLSHAALFVLSSRWEGLPGALIEALACGTKVISTDCPSGPREILGNGIYGQLVPVGDNSAMAEAMLKALSGTYIAATPTERIGLFEAESNIDRYLELLVGPSN
jgi:glycosyltransferase involved in cell wall biosynthesis